MKHSDSTEMDRLLRRYARRNGETLRAGQERGDDVQGASTSVHLDADELNAYAEGALPESARSRYFAHLADCDTCRKLVTDLTLAAVAANEAEARVIAPPSKSWREWLAAFFSPPVLRYGVPALALFAIIVVAVVALRTQRERPSFVAQNDEAWRHSVPSSAANANSSAETSASTMAESHANGNATSNTAAINEENMKAAPPVATATPTAAQAAPVDQSMPPAPQQPVTERPAVAKTETTNTGSREAGADDKRAQEVVIASKPEAAQTAPATVAASRRRDEEEQAKVAKDEAASKAGAAGGVVQNQPQANEDRVAGARRARSTQGQPAAGRAPEPKGESRKEDSEDTLSAETRSVGGHRFRRQGGAWVDTAYNSSYPTVNVRRGSEQYRALVADEPNLRAVAQQLGGEVIVVWGRKAYRFY